MLATVFKNLHTLFLNILCYGKIFKAGENSIHEHSVLTDIPSACQGTASRFPTFMSHDTHT
jgi:hypothetical protein